MKINVLRFVVFVSVIFFLGPLCVKADPGDVRYDITNVYLNGSNITFEGWAFIHKTNNFTNVVDSLGNTVISGGDQKILMRAVKKDNIGTIIDVIETNVVQGNDDINYNFYCELFAVESGIECVNDNYINVEFNKCNDTSNYCYYEDIHFRISFDVSGWSVQETDNIGFQLAVSNADFESKPFSHFVYNGDFFTNLVNVSISSASVNDLSSDFITIDNSSLEDVVKFIAGHGILRDFTNISQNFEYEPGVWGGCAYGVFDEDAANKIYNLVDTINYDDGRSDDVEFGRCYSFLGNDCYGTYNYAISVSNNSGSKIDNYGNFICHYVARPCSGVGCRIAIARGSHIQLKGETVFKINITNDKKCPVVTPSSGSLECNNSKTYNSTCDELTVITTSGRATVKIEQIGTISSVLTPSRTFAGGGFNFGVLYQNSIKWSYVGVAPNSTLHNEVKNVMNNKIKDYATYVAGLEITQLKFGDVNYGNNFLEKKCYTSASPVSDKDYYNNELIVTCVFTFPEATFDYNGDVNYIIVGNAININNKYYTPIDFSGIYKLEAEIIGMSRITGSAAISDSVNSDPWTGDWEDTFEDCEIDIYPLFYKDNPPPGSGSNYNFIYRPIDLNNPFPNRNAGINWYDWYSDPLNKADLEDAYSDLEYTVVLDNQTVSDIKAYNQGKNYLNWDSIDNNGKSSFITGFDYVTRESGS